MFMHGEGAEEARAFLYRYLLYILTVMPRFTVNLIYLLCVTVNSSAWIAKNYTEKRFYGGDVATSNDRIFVRWKITPKTILVWKDDTQSDDSKRFAVRGCRYDHQSNPKSNIKYFIKPCHNKHTNPAAYIHTTLRFLSIF